MPSKSPAQHRLMEVVAHSPKFAKKAGIPTSVGQDFAMADDKAGITKTHGGLKSSPKSRDEHIARRAKTVTQGEAAGEFKTSQSTVSRRVRKAGYQDMGKV